MSEALYAFPYSVILPAGGAVHRRGEASMVLLSGGRVLIAYANHTQHRDSGVSPIEGDNDRADICATVLDAAGRPRGPERLLVKRPEGALNVMSPALRRLPDGRLGMLYSRRASTTAADRMFCASSDQGLTWSSPVAVAGGGYTTGCHDRMTVLSTGRIIAPLHRTKDWDRHYMYAQTAQSDDGGGRWTLSNRAALPYVGAKYGWKGGFIESGCVEPSVAERADGSLLMSLRTAMGTVFCAESFDRGTTWERLRSMEVISPQAPAHLSRIPGTDDLLLLWNADYDPGANLGGARSTIMACVSTDNGKSWPHAARKTLVHDPDHSVDYPAVLFRQDEVWITFRRSSTTRISGGETSSGLMRVPLRWLYPA